MRASDTEPCFNKPNLNEQTLSPTSGSICKVPQPAARMPGPSDDEEEKFSDSAIVRGTSEYDSENISVILTRTRRRELLNALKKAAHSKTVVI